MTYHSVGYIVRFHETNCTTLDSVFGVNCTDDYDCGTYSKLFCVMNYDISDGSYTGICNCEEGFMFNYTLNICKTGNVAYTNITALTTTESML